MATKNDQHALQRLLAQFVLHGRALYKKSPHHILLRCLNEAEASTIIQDIHGGECSPQLNVIMLTKKIL